MRVLVTGGTGFLGSYILRTLVKAGVHEITALKRPTSQLSLVQDIQDKISWVDCDILDVISLDDVGRGQDCIIHTAALVSFDPKDKKKIFDINVEGTANLVNMSLHHAISKFIYVSSTIAMGSARPTLISEEDQWSESPIKSNYARSKYLGEQEVWRGCAEGLIVTIIAPPMVIGAGFWDSSTSIFSEIDNGLDYYPIGSNGMVDVRDVARFIDIVINDDKADNQKFICSAENITLQELSHKVATALEQKSPNKPLSGFILYLAKIYAVLNGWFHFNNKIFKEPISIASELISYDNIKSKDLLNMEYRSIDSTIIDTAAAFKKAKINEESFSVFELD